MRRRPEFEIVATDRLDILANEPLHSWYQLSPFVWQTKDGFAILLRGVPRHDENPALKISRIFYGVSHDGIVFSMDDEPVIVPGPDAYDLDGCEDPTVAVADGRCYVFYTGWNEERKVATLLYARGDDIYDLEKRGIAIASTDRRKNPKEATLARVPDGWSMFYEFSDGGASRIGLARSRALDERWTILGEPFASQPESWDSWHLSTGPIIEQDGLPLMFYNGATRDAKWRIGWVRFDERCATVVDRCDEPVIGPGLVTGNATDIAFASSAIEHDGRISLYYSVSDRELMRATLHRR